MVEGSIRIFDIVSGVSMESERARIEVDFSEILMMVISSGKELKEEHRQKEDDWTVSF